MPEKPLPDVAGFQVFLSGRVYLFGDTRAEVMAKTKPRRVLVFKRSDFFPGHAPRSFRRALEQEAREKRAPLLDVLRMSLDSILDNARDADVERLVRRSASEFVDALLATRAALKHDRMATKSWLR